MFSWGGAGLSCAVRIPAVRLRNGSRDDETEGGLPLRRLAGDQRWPRGPSACRSFAHDTANFHSPKRFRLSHPKDREQSTQQLSYLIRTDGNTLLGIGHVKRCLALAEALQSRTVFALRHTSPSIEALIRHAGHDYIVVVVDLAEEAAWLRPHGGGDGIILDISHSETMRILNELPAYVTGLQHLFPTVWMIDGMGPDALCQSASIKADATVVPYVGARAGKHGLWLTGPRYCILGAEYTTIGERLIREEPRRVLVTAGGSDPAALSLLALAALGLITDRALEVRLVEGIAFSPSLKKEIRSRLHASNLDVLLLRAPISLFEHMLWCDLCISTSGLTKYELAATGTPALLLSSDRESHAAGRAFNTSNTAMYLGEVCDMTPLDVASYIKLVLDDRDCRLHMSARGRRLVDAKGASRVAALIRSATSFQECPSRRALDSSR